MNELDHVGIYVKDLEEAIGFYSKVFSFEVAKTMETSTSKIAFLEIGGGFLELIQRPGAPGKPPEGRWTHLAIEVGDYGAMEGKLEEMGLVLRKVRLDDGTRIAFFKDPDGHDIEIMSKP